MILVDTMVLIDIQRGRPSVAAKLGEFIDDEFYISEISIKELYDGLGYTRITLGEEFYLKQHALIEEILSDFHHIPIDEQILKLTGLKEGELRAQGIIIDFEDILIGISAQVKHAKLIISKNTKHFKYFSIPCESYARD